MMVAVRAVDREGVSPRDGFGVVKDLPRGTRRRGVAASLIFSCLALLARPFSADMFGDQFSYARTAYDFARTGHFVYNGWATAMLGWQILWGDLFVRLFGFSSDVLRMSVLLLGTLSIYLFHQILARFGIYRQLAFFGALSLGLTPLFFPLAASFMTDIPGLFVTLLCVALCQRAVIASTPAGTMAWLVAAAATNVVGGTARQICWLGVLVMVPCTAWLLRSRRGVLVCGCLCAVLGAVAVRSLLHWFIRHPHAIPEHMNLRATSLRYLPHLAQQEIRSALFLVLITAPVGVLYLTEVRRLSRGALLRVLAAVLILGVSIPVSGGWEAVDRWSMPWLTPILHGQGMQENVANLVTLSLGVRAGISLATLALGLLLVEVAIRFKVRLSPSVDRNRAMLWLLGPFSIALVAMMGSRAMFTMLQDRYLLLLVPVVVTVLLWAYQHRVASRVSPVGVGVLAVFALYGMAGLHDIHLSARATEAMMAEVRGAGVPRDNISEGFGPDEWFEVDRHGFLNNVSAAPTDYRLYKPNVADWHLANACMPMDYDLIPSLHPSYVLGTGRAREIPACYEPSRFPPVRYRTWLPPWNRQAYAGIPAGKPAGEAPYLRNQWGAKPMKMK